MRFLIGILMIVLVSSIGLCQDIEGFSGVKTETGMILVYSNNRNNFMFYLEGEKINKIETEFLFSIDDKIFQILTIPISEFYNETYDEKTILEKYCEYEKNYIENLVDIKCEI